MSAPKKNEPTDSQGVLSNLPRTRPQRSSPRRAAARKATAAANAAEPKLSSPTTRATASADRRGTPSTNGRPIVATKDAAQRATAARASMSPKRARSATKRAASVPAAAEPVPRQGFECEGERASGPVQPPGGTELVAGAAELIGELAKAGFSTGERLFKDVLSRLPLS